MSTILGYNAQSALLPLQEALFARLSGELDTPVYDYVPEDAPYPYITIGEATEISDNDHSSFGREMTITLHIWAKTRAGFAVPKTIANQLTELLDHQRDLTLDGHRVVSIKLDQTLTMRDPDPLIRHVPIRFRVKTEQLNVG